MHPLLRYARASRAAYWSAQGGLMADVLAECAQLGLSFVGQRDTTDGDRHCLAMRDATTLVIAFTGTKDARNLAEDLDAIPVFFQGTRLAINCCYVHKGFRDGWLALRDWCKAVILANRAQGIQQVVMTGHSLGGAEATCAAADCPTDLPVLSFTYGSPRVGMPDFVAAYNDAGIETVRCVHTEDGIPLLPPAGPYKHVDSLLHLRDDGSVIGPAVGWFTGLFRRTAATVDGEWLRDHGIEKYVATCSAYAAAQGVAA